jgi:hypothetical protein
MRLLLLKSTKKGGLISNAGSLLERLPKHKKMWKIECTTSLWRR